MKKIIIQSYENSHNIFVARKCLYYPNTRTLDYLIKVKKYIKFLSLSILFVGFHWIMDHEISINKPKE